MNLPANPRQPQPWNSHRATAEFLSDVTDFLSGCRCPIDDGHYPNRIGATGYWVIFQTYSRLGVRFLMVSRHNTSWPINGRQMADEFLGECANPNFAKFGCYPNKNGALGEFATVGINLATGHHQWYMLSLSAWFPEINQTKMFGRWRRRWEFRMGYPGLPLTPQAKSGQLSYAVLKSGLLQKGGGR